MSEFFVRVIRHLVTLLWCGALCVLGFSSSLELQVCGCPPVYLYSICISSLSFTTPFTPLSKLICLSGAKWIRKAQKEDGLESGRENWSGHWCSLRQEPGKVAFLRSSKLLNQKKFRCVIIGGCTHWVSLTRLSLRKVRCKPL